jgi:hypothetical protein
MIANAISMYSERGRPKELPGPATQEEKRADINARVGQLAAEDKIRINSHLTQREAARIYGVTTRYVQQAKAVYEADQTLAHKVHQGEITVTAALKEIDRCHNPPKDPPPENLPNLKYREWLDGAFKALTSLEGYLRQITVYSRPPVPDEVGWAREVELKRQLTTLCAMIPKLCINEVGESWDGRSEGASWPKDR